MLRLPLCVYVYWEHAVTCDASSSHLPCSLNGLILSSSRLPCSFSDLILSSSLPVPGISLSVCRSLFLDILCSNCFSRCLCPSLLPSFSLSSPSLSLSLMICTRINVSHESPNYGQARRIKILTTQRISTACCRPFVIDRSLSDSIMWLAMDRNSTISRWDIKTRRLVKPHGTLDCRSIEGIACSVSGDPGRIGRPVDGDIFF